jgi:hypothetical protein
MELTPAEKAEAIRLIDKIVAEHMEEIRERGHKAGLRTAILRVCAIRKLKLTAVQRAALVAEDDVNTLQRWVTCAATAGSTNEVFAAA